MKLFSLLPIGFFAVNTVSAAKLIGRSEISLATTNTPVPGQSPLFYCETTKLEENIIKIDHVDITPNPPLPGKELVLEAAGTVKELINFGAYILVEVKYGLIKLVNQKLDLCDYVGHVNLTCPIAPGAIHMKKSIELPKAIPPGRYYVKADVYNDDNLPITCLTATVDFRPGFKVLVDL